MKRINITYHMENAEGVHRMKISRAHYEAVAHFIERKEL